jgi:hypothetical protein
LKPIPHPKPFQSQLWPHLDLIRKLRLSRKTWPEIAAELSTVGIRMNPWAIRRFFKHAQGRKLPLGFGLVATRAPVQKSEAEERGSGKLLIVSQVKKRTMASSGRTLGPVKVTPGNVGGPNRQRSKSGSRQVQIFCVVLTFENCSICVDMIGRD